MRVYADRQRMAQALSAGTHLPGTQKNQLSHGAETPPHPMRLRDGFHGGLYRQCRGCAVMPMGSMAVYTGSVGASGSSPACLQDRGHSGFSIACGGGRPSSRPYSYAIHCAVRLRNGLHEVYTGSVGASGSSPACLQDRGHSGFSIACSAGDLPVAPTATRYTAR